MFRRRKTHTGLPGDEASKSVQGNGSRHNSLMNTLRTRSMPNMRKPKGVMKFITADESMHSKYGETKESGSQEEAKHIEFHQIMIREYARTVGDNPSCSSGPPVAIGWEYNPETTELSVDQYEKCRPPRRSHFEMVLPRSVRQDMLRKEWNVSQSQIASAVRNNIKIKNQRRNTVRNLGKAEKMEEMMESASKKVMRGLFLKKSTDKQVEELEKQIDSAEKARQQSRLEQFYVEEHQSSGEAGELASENGSEDLSEEPSAPSTMNTGDSLVES